MSVAEGEPQTPWKRKESSRDRKTDEITAKANLSVDVEKAQERSIESSTLGSPTSLADDDADASVLLRRRARAVHQLMTIGRLTAPVQHRDCFELFIGGYANDFLHERNIIHTKVLPQVCRWCLDAGVEFDAVDMMHCTNDILPPEPIDGNVCKREAIECATKSTIGLKYISLIGNKVGPRPLPEKVSKSVLNEMLHHAATEDEKELVRSWYVPDPLSFPQQFMLLSPLYAAQVMQEGADLDDLEPEDKLDAAKNYVDIDKGLRRVIEAGLSAHHPELLPKSLLEGELEIFLGSGTGAAAAVSAGHNKTQGSPKPAPKSPAKGKVGESQSSQCMMILRTLRGIIETDPKARSYLDFTAEGLPDPDSAQLIDWLHTSGVQEYMGSANKAVRGLLNWQSTGLSVHHPQYEPYFVSVEEKVMSMIKESIDNDIKTRTAHQLAIASSGADEGAPGLLAEIRAHVQHAHQLDSKFVLPEADDLVALLSRAPKGGEAQPLFLVGAVGSGKTSIIAQVAVRLCEQEHQRAHGDGRQHVAASPPRLPGLASDRSDLDSPKKQGEVPDDTPQPSPLAVFGALAHNTTSYSPTTSLDGEAGDGFGTSHELPRVIITRFSNISAQSRSARGVLASITAQLRWVVANLGGGTGDSGQEPEPDADGLSYEALAVNLPSLMREAGTCANILIMVDGIEECAPEHHPERNVDWIPMRLPPNVRLLVSLAGSVSPIAKPDPYATPIQEACCQLVKDRLRDRLLHSKHVIEVAPIKSATQKALTEHMLNANGRRLTKEYEAELEALQETSLMLFLSLCLRFMCWVKPSTDGEGFKVPRSILSLLDTSFEILAGVHGEAITNTTLGFLCAAHPHGLTEIELLDLISCADDVFREQADTGYTPPQKRVSRRQWAMLKDDLVALGFIFETSCFFGSTWSFSHVTIEAMVRERQVPEPTMIACLKNLAGLYSGKLKDTMAPRLILSCVDDDVLGPSLVRVPTLGDKTGDEDGGVDDKSTMSSQSKCAVMQAGGGINKRKLVILPAALNKLTALTGGAFADPLTAHITDPALVERFLEAGMGEELAIIVADAMRCISRLPAKRAMLERCLTRLAALVAANDFFCGSQTFGYPPCAGLHGHADTTAPEAQAISEDGGDATEPDLASTRPLTAHSIESMLSSQEGLAKEDGGRRAAGSKGEALGALGVPVLKLERVKERLMEWEVERFTVLCRSMKKTLLDKSRDPETASLAPIPTIPSVTNLRVARKQDAEAAQFELKAGIELAWTAHKVLENECLRAGEPRFSPGGIKQVLIAFLKDHLVSLSQMQMLLLTRSHLATDKSDHEGWLATVGPQLDAIHRYKDYETLVLRDLESLEEGVAEQALEAASLVHFRWLAHRHASRWPLDKLATQLRWFHVSRKAEIYRRVEKQSKVISARDACSHDVKDGLLLFPSFLSPLVGCAYTTIGIMSLTDHKLDQELEVLRTEAGMEEEIDADDGFRFGNAVFSLAMKVVEETATDFKRKDGIRSNQTRRGTWRKAMPTSAFVHPIYARYDAVLQASTDQMHKMTSSGKEDKVGGNKAEVDATLQNYFEILGQHRVSYVNICIKDLVKQHTPRLQEQLKDPMKARAIKAAHADEDIVEGGKIKVDLSDDKLNSVYSLRIIGMRRARRRILGILNVFAILHREMELAAALLDAPAASADKIMAEMKAMQHKLDIDANGVVHTVDTDGEIVIYDTAYDELFRLEAEVLLTATQFCQIAERESIPEKSKVLHDYLQCELALQEAKLRLVLVLLDVLQHSAEVSERRHNIQMIVDSMHARAPTNLSSPFVSSVYHAKVSVLNLQAELLAKVVAHQQHADRSYTNQIHSQQCPNTSLAGFPLQVVPSLQVAQTLGISSKAFRLFPTPPPPKPPPAMPRPDLEETPPTPSASPGPVLPSLSMVHARSEVLPSLGAATQTTQICCDIAADLAAAFVSTDNGITWLVFEQAVLEEAMQLVEARQERKEDDLGALSKARDASAAASTRAAVSPRQLAPPIQMSTIDNPVAVRDILETQRLDPLVSAKPDAPEHGGDRSGMGSRVFQGVCRALELVHRRWLLCNTLWEIEVLEKATAKLVKDYQLEEPSGKKAPAAPPAKAQGDEDSDDVPPCYFALGHEVDELAPPLPYLQLVGLKEKDLEIDFRGVKGVSKMLKDPQARNSVSAQSALKLGHVLQLAMLRKHTLAVALEYNATHLDALLALHNARLADAEAQGAAVSEGNGAGSSGILMDGSRVKPRASKEQLLMQQPSLIKPVLSKEVSFSHAWPVLHLLPPYRQRLLESLVSAEGLLCVAENVVTVPFAAPMSEKVERVVRALCDELQLPSLIVQGVKEAQLLRSFWFSNQAVLNAPQDPLLLHEPRERHPSEKRKGAVLEEVRPGAVSINLWRIPLAIEMFSLCLDKAALKGYATASRALYDTLCLIKARALCAGEPGSAVVEQMRRDVGRLRDRLASNITSALVPPHLVAAYLVRVRNNCISAHLLVLRQARATLLHDNSLKAASLVRYMYHDTLNGLLCDKAHQLKGLPPLGDADAERRRWGTSASRYDSCSGMGFLLKHLHVDERRAMEKDFMALDKSVADCLRMNNVYPERDMIKAADLQRELLADSTRLESIKTLLVYQIAGLGEPHTADQLSTVKVTFENFLKKVMSGTPDAAAAAAAEVDDAPAIMPEISEALEGEVSDVVTDVSSNLEAGDDMLADAGVMASMAAEALEDLNADTGLNTGMRDRVSMLQDEATLSFLIKSQHAAQTAAASLLKGIEKLQRAARRKAASIVPCSPAGSVRSARFGGDRQARRGVKTAGSSAIGQVGQASAAEAALDRPEALWKEFLEGLAPLMQEELIEDAGAGAGAGGCEDEGDGEAVVMVRIKKHDFFQLTSKAAHMLSAWLQDREAAKARHIRSEIHNLNSKLRGAEQDGKFLAHMLERISHGTQRLTFQALVDKYGSRLYQLTSLTKSWAEMERRCMQHRYDTETRVQDEFDANIGRTKGELSSVRGNLNDDCNRYSDMMNTEMVQICQEEKLAVIPMVNRRFQQMLNHDGPRKNSDGLKEAEAKEEALRKERDELQHRLSLDVYFLRFKLCIRASHFEKEEHALLAKRHDFNKERYALQRNFAPLPRQLQAVTDKLEAVELELGSVSKELETINVDKLDLLTSKVKINKAIEKIQKEFGFTDTEEADPRLAAVARIDALDEEIRLRQEELHDIEAEQAIQGKELLFGEAAEARIREARDAVMREQRAKLWAYRQLDSHRKELDTFMAIKDAHDGGLLQSAFMESKARVYEYWDRTLAAQNDLLRATLQAHGVEVPATLAAGARASPETQEQAEDGHAGDDAGGAGGGRPATPEDMCIRAPSKAYIRDALASGERSRAPAETSSSSIYMSPSAARERRRAPAASYAAASGAGINNESLSAEPSMSSIKGSVRGSLSEPSLPHQTGARATSHSSVDRGLSGWVHKEASKLSSASLDVVRRNAPQERRVLLLKSGLDEPVSFSRAIDLGLTSKRRGHGGGGGKHEKRQAEEGKGPASYTDTLLASSVGAAEARGRDVGTRLPPVTTPVKMAIAGASRQDMMMIQGGGADFLAAQAGTREGVRPSILYDSKGYPTKVDISRPLNRAVFTKTRRS